jgi:hypothetical protein
MHSATTYGSISAITVPRAESFSYFCAKGDDHREIGAERGDRV